MAVTRLMPTPESEELIALVRDIAAKEVAPKADRYEKNAEFPSEVFHTLGQAGLLGLPFDEEFGGANQPYEVYLQCIEELSSAWMAIGVGVSIHVLTCFPINSYGTQEQKERLLPSMIGGEWFGSYCLSEPAAGSDVASMRTKAVGSGDVDETGRSEEYAISGGKMWISHAGHADFYTTFARTGENDGKGISCFHVPGDAPGLTFAEPERKMGLHSDTVREVLYDKVTVPGENLIGTPGKGLGIALAALDSGRLGIAAASTGLAQAATDLALKYAAERQQFGKPIAENQGLQFMLADMQAQTSAARATYLHAARLKDAGKKFSREAAIAKLFASDTAMKVTTDAIQVLGGYGYTTDFPAERYFRDAKITQIFEGTNQIQRMVIARDMLKSLG